MHFSDNRPIYIQISDYFCRQILLEKWVAGDRIPSVRDIAVQLEVNPNTAIRAFHELQDEGILHNQRGVGYFVSDKAYEKVKRLKRQEFIEKKLPHLFRDMDELGITIAQLADLYQNRTKS